MMQAAWDAMSWALAALAVVALAAGTATAEPRWSVHGQPICGSFAVTWEPDELRQAQQTGINLVFCYDRRASAAMLDPETELGAIAREGNTGVVANFLQFAHGAMLAEDTTADATELKIAAGGALPDAGVLWIDDEAIEYTGREGQVFSGCTRGARGTTAAAHPAGTYLLEESVLIDRLDAAKSSPNLWGFWVLDDKRGNQLPALRNLYRLIREHDVDDQGRPYDHVVVAGFGSVESLTNMGPDMCDMAGLYLYPARRGTYHVSETNQLLTQMVPTIRERDPDAGIIGIYQAFHAPRYEPKVTRLQVRQQVQDFLRWGASGVMAYSWHMVEGAFALRNLPDLREEVASIAADLREGRLAVERTPPTPPAPVAMTANPDALLPLMQISAETQASKPSAGLSVELGPVPGQEGTWLHLRFEKYAEGGNQWPGIGFTPDAGQIETTDWSPFAALAVRMMNLTDEDSEIGVTIHGVTGMWARYYPVPAGGPHDVLVDLTEVRGAIPISQISRVSVIMRRPPVATHLALGGLYLLPMQFEVTDAQVAVPEAAGDQTWEGAAIIELVDATGEPPLKPCSVRLMRGEGELLVQVTAAVPDPALLVAEATEPDAPMAGEDLIEILLRPAGAERVARLRVNAKGAVRDELLGPAGADLGWSWGAQVRSEVAGGAWTVQVSLPLAPLGADADRWEANFRRIDTELRPLAWVSSDTPGYEALGTLTLAPGR